MRTNLTRLSVAVCVASLALLVVQPGRAASITVNALEDDLANDPVSCSLREALLAASTDSVGGCPAGSGADTIDFAVSGTLSLAAALPDVSGILDIAGPGASALTIDGMG
jgi:CSLREA domain-containing protein